MFSKVTGLFLSGCHLESCDEWKEAMSEMINLSIFVLNSCSVTPAGMVNIASLFDSAPKLTRIEIHLSHVSGVERDDEYSILRWGRYLRSLKWLKTFILTGCVLHVNDAKYIAASLGLMKNLVLCQISRNYKSTELLFKCYNDPRKEIYLFLNWCSLTSSELSDILSGLKTREDLFKIYLSENPLLGGLAITWAQHLKDLKLPELDLRGCALQSTDIEPLAVSLSDMSTLTSLNLSCNPSLGGNAVSWAAHLGQLNQLKEITLRNCSLTGVDIEPIAKSVGNVQSLNLSGNTQLKHSVASQGPSFRCLERFKGFVYLW